MQPVGRDPQITSLMKDWELPSSPANRQSRWPMGVRPEQTLGTDPEVSKPLGRWFRPVGFADMHETTAHLPERCPTQGRTLRGRITAPPLAGTRHGVATLQSVCPRLLEHATVPQPSNCAPGHLAQEMKLSCRFMPVNVYVSFICNNPNPERNCMSFIG